MAPGSAREHKRASLKKPTRKAKAQRRVRAAILAMNAAIEKTKKHGLNLGEILKGEINLMEHNLVVHKKLAKPDEHAKGPDQLSKKAIEYCKEAI